MYKKESTSSSTYMRKSSKKNWAAPTKDRKKRPVAVRSQNLRITIVPPTQSNKMSVADQKLKNDSAPVRVES